MIIPSNYGVLKQKIALKVCNIRIRWVHIVKWAINKIHKIGRHCFLQHLLSASECIGGDAGQESNHFGWLSTHSYVRYGFQYANYEFGRCYKEYHTHWFARGWPVDVYRYEKTNMGTFYYFLAYILHYLQAAKIVVYAFGIWKHKFANVHSIVKRR